MSAALSPEHREAARQLAEGMSSTLTDHQKVLIGREARGILLGLRDICDSDSSAARVAMTIARLFATLQVARVQDISEVLDSSIAGYGLVAGALAGVYVLPGAPDGEQVQPTDLDVAPGVPDDGLGSRYL